MPSTKMAAAPFFASRLALNQNGDNTFRHPLEPFCARAAAISQRLRLALNKDGARARLAAAILWAPISPSPQAPESKMALASVLRAELPEFSPYFPKSFPKRFLEDFPEDSEGIPEILRDPPGPPRLLAAPPRGLEAEPEGLGLHILHGTTTLAFKTPLGVTVAVDSRATAGSYIASQAVRKAVPLGGRMLGTMAGGAADCAFWQRLVARQCRVQELRNKEPVSLAAASKLLANLVYQYKGLGLSMGTMLCGWDKRGPGLYYVDSEGQRVAGAAFAVGSGSSYAFGVLDRGLAEAPGSEAAACGLARRAVYQAARRDAYSGGSVRVFHVGPEGWREVSHDDMADLQEIYGD